MIKQRQGDLLQDGAEALVNAVNCVGVMGGGIALQFKQAYPEMFEDYEQACKKKEVQPGKMHVVAVKSHATPKYIINFPTKRHWKDDSRLEDIKSGLVDLVNVVKEREIKSIAIPPIGCGLGGLDWTEVRPLIVEAFAENEDVEVRLYEPL